MFYKLFPVEDKIIKLLSMVDADDSTKVEFEKKIIELVLMKFLEQIEKVMDEIDKEYVENMVGDMQGNPDQNTIMRFQSIFQQPKFKAVYDEYLAKGIDKLLLDLETMARKGS